MINLLKPHIYKRQIITTGKYYIGKHIGTNKYYKGGGIDYTKDLKKYVKNFNEGVITEILEYVNDVSKLNEREIYWLNKFDVVNNPLFYNKTNKSFGIDRKRTIEEKKSIGDKNKIHRTGKINSLKTRLKISQAKKGIKLPGTSEKLKGRISPNKGKIYSDESKQKISQAKKGKKNPGAKKHKGRISPNKGKKWNDKQKQRITGRTDSYITKMNKSISHKKPILQYDLEGNFIREWDSQKDAEIGLNLKSKISQCLSGRYKKVGNFKWKYK